MNQENQWVRIHDDKIHYLNNEVGVWQTSDKTPYSQLSVQGMANSTPYGIAGHFTTFPIITYQKVLSTRLSHLLSVSTGSRCSD